jgi:hypothetical protein
MRKSIICIITGLILLLTGTAGAATYTLPEKMQNQLAIGSGLKGTITVTAEGELSKDPFLNAVSDATYDLRGMASGHDLHYYLFQEYDGKQTNLAEMYRKDGQYYFRSDVIPDTILGLTGFSVYLDGLFAEKGENPTLTSALTNYLALPEDTKEKQWKPVFNKYQNALEMWLHDFTAQADVVKQENGSSAFDFSYVIPIAEAKNKMVSLFAEFAADQELQGLLDTIMPKELKDLYFNGAFLWFYEDALNALDLKNDIRLSKRVSALGDLINSTMVLPLDPKVTGYDSITIESANGYSIYRLEGTDKAIVLGLPDIDLLADQEYERSVWVSRIDNTQSPGEENGNFSVRADIRKTFRTYNDEEDRSHQEEHYEVKICQDTTYLPESHKDDDLGEWHDIEADLDLHYHSKYSQNSATTLEIKAGYRQNGSAVAIDAKLKTAAPWLFMPFEAVNPTEIGPDHPEITEEYRTDWISNAASLIHHTEETEAETVPAETEAPEAEPETETESENEPETESDVSDSAEAAPLPEEPETGENAE